MGGEDVGQGLGNINSQYTVSKNGWRKGGDEDWKKAHHKCQIYLS